MRIEVKLLLEKPTIPKDNKPMILSLFKKALSNDNKERYEQLYGTNKCIVKPFCFALKLNNPVFNCDEIKLGGNEFLCIISTNDMVLGIDLYNTLLKMRDTSFPIPNDNKMEIKEVKIKNTPSVEANKILIHMLSPLVLRQHFGKINKNDKYITCEDDNFNEVFLENTKYLLGNLYSVNVGKNDIKIEKVRSRKTVTVLFGQKISCSIGDFELSGRKEILNLLYNVGIGSKRSQGNGLFNIIEMR